MTQIVDASPLELTPTQEAKLDARSLWMKNRIRMESENMKSKQYGGKSRHYWSVLLWMTQVLQLGLKITGLYERGVRNAKNIAMREIPVVLPDLPSAFHGFTILQLSDLHLDGMPGLEHILLEVIGEREFDLCIFTGDYRKGLRGPVQGIMGSLKTLVNHIQSRRGFLGILGNHDDTIMVAPMEAMGIQMLINEHLILEKNGQHIQVIGTDDIHYYYTDLAKDALEPARSMLTIGLVHSPEFYKEAASSGVDLYLCGHTHSGQVCLPGGIPLITHLNCGRAFFRGQWQYKAMQGITNAGAGTSGIPVRFNTQGEVLSIKLLCH